MNPAEMGELLVRIDERLMSVQSKVDEIHAKANNGGWSRCATNRAHIEDLRGEVDTLRGNQRKVLFGGLAAFIAGLVGMGFTMVKELPPVVLPSTPPAIIQPAQPEGGS